MGDDRPAIYNEGGIWIYRASSFGSCIKELVATRCGFPPAPFPAKFTKIFADGHRGEDTIIAMLEERGFNVTRRQEEINWEVLPGHVIRGHIDGVIWKVGGDDPAIFDAKTTTAKYGIAANLMTKYELQLSIYGHALGLTSAVLGVGVKDPDSGDVVSADTHTLDTLPVSRADIIKRLHAINRAAQQYEATSDLPACDVANQYPCFPAGTFVMTDTGYRPIEHVSVGDKVLTHRARFRTVTEVTQQPDAELVKVKATGVPDLRCTDEHPFLARERWYHHNKSNTAAVRKLRDQEWVEAVKLTRSHFLAQVQPPEVADTHTPEFWWLVGRYLADGWVSDRSNVGVHIRCAREEADDLLAGIHAAGLTARRYDEQTVVKYRISAGQGFGEDLADFGKYAYGKRLPLQAMSLDPIRSRSLLDGYLSGDGHYEVNAWTASSVSKELALGMSMVAQRIGIVAGVTFAARSATGVIEGRTVNQRPVYRQRFPDRNNHAFLEDGVAWRAVKDITPLDDRADVYNLHVDEDESYMAEGAVVHNCSQYLLHEVEGDDDPYGGMTEPVLEDDSLDRFMADYLAAQQDEAEAKDRKANARKMIVAHVGGEGENRKTDKFELVWTGTGITTELDKKALGKFLAAHEKTIDEFMGTKSKAKSISVKEIA